MGDHYDMYDEKTVQQYMGAGESTLWIGKSLKGHLFTKSDIFMVPFSILWCGFAIFWEYNAIRTGPVLFSVFGIPFVLVGLYIVIGRFFIRAYCRKHAIYAVTNRRVLRIMGKKMTMIELHALQKIEIRLYSDGSGTITFGENTVYGPRAAWGEAALSFVNIPDANDVLQMIQTAREP